MSQVRLRRQDLGCLSRCYAVCAHTATGELLFASEDSVDSLSFPMVGNRFAFPFPGEGGIMSLLPLPNRPGALLAVERFYPPFLAEDAQIVLLDEHKKKDVLAKLPYVHRIELIQTDTTLFLVAATVCTTKTENSDWSSPGQLYVCPLSEQITVPLTLTPLPWKLHRNHGMSHCAHGLVIGADEGAFLLQPPTETRDWQLTPLTNTPCGEAVLWDLDGDGVDELLCIESFHGDSITIRKQREDGLYHSIWQSEIPLDFSHALWAGIFCGKPTAFLGHRRGLSGLYSIRYEHGSYHLQLIDSGGAPANLAVWRSPIGDCLLVSNHGEGVCSLYQSE